MFFHIKTMVEANLSEIATKVFFLNDCIKNSKLSKYLFSGTIYTHTLAMCD